MFRKRSPVLWWAVNTKWQQLSNVSLHKICVWGSFQYCSNFNTCERSLENVLFNNFDILLTNIWIKKENSSLDRQFRVRLPIILTIPFLPSHMYFFRTKYIIHLAAPLRASYPFWVWIFCMTEFTSKIWKIKSFFTTRCVWYGITQMMHVFIMGPWLIQGHASYGLP